MSEMPEQSKMSEKTEKNGRRQALLDAALATARIEAARRQPVFAVITGSVASGAISSRSDIDIIFASADQATVSYRYYMPEITGVAVRTEVGRIPVAYLEQVLKSGYADEISTGVREQLRAARVLLGDRQAAQEMISRFAQLKPKKKLLGEYLYQAKQALGRARAALAAGNVTESALALDRASKNIWRLLLVARHKVGVQKDKHEIRAARQELGAAELGEYLAARRIAGADEHEARARLGATQKMVSKTLELAGVDSKIVGDIGDPDERVGSH
jgi:predicted nucleotidyltransferase